MAQNGQPNTGRALGVMVSRPTFGGMTVGGSTGPTCIIDLGYSSTSKIGMYGVTPVTQRSTTGGAVVATTVAVSTTTGATTSWGFSSSTQANALTAQVADIYNALTSIGLLSA